MPAKILLTSFQTWLPHQQSNSSDDLLALLQQQHGNLSHLSFLRQLPVDIHLATEQVVSNLETEPPGGIICCGMAEKRKKLTVESQARCQQECLYSTVNIPELIKSLTFTQISHDAGKFVCEGLYYQLLKYLQSRPQTIPCLFVHVPILNQSNHKLIQQDLNSIIKHLEQIITDNKKRSPEL